MWAIQAACALALTDEQREILEQVDSRTRDSRSTATRATSGRLRSAVCTGAGKLWEIGAGPTEIRQVIIAGELLGR